MSRKLLERSLWLLLATTVAVSAGMAQTSSPYLKSSQPQTSHFSRLPGVLETQRWDWTTEAWNGDNVPYHQARLGIDKVADAGHGLAEILIKYKVQAQLHPEDALATFRWAYTAYRVMLTRNTTLTQHKALDGVQEALRLADPPHAYDYDRIRFLVGEFYTSHREAVPIAKRLLVIDNNDYHVGYSLAAIYLNDYVHPKIEEALSICNHLKQLYPAKSSLYTLAGETYVLWWYEDKQSSHARGVVENYEKYLQLAPPKDEFRKQAEWIIKDFKAKLN